MLSMDKIAFLTIVLVAICVATEVDPIVWTANGVV
jgi:hypothetical protein